MIYSTGTISINGNTATGSGTNWTAPASQVRAGQTIIVMSNPVQMFQISSVNSATSMTVTPAASPALSGQNYGILVSDNISVDGLAQAMSQLIKEYDENIGAWETFATTSANQSITVTINGTTVTIPGIGKLAQKGSNGALAIADGGTGATNAADALTYLGLNTALDGKQPKDATLTALAGLVGVANKLPYFNGADTAALTDLTLVGRDIIGKGTVAEVFTYLGLASAATMTAATLVVNGGTLTATIPVVVNGVNRALILHAGQVTSASVSAGTITFPSAFPSACIVALTHDFATSASDLSSVRFDVPTRSYANWSGQNTSTGAAQSPITWCWLAIGW